MEMVCEAHLRSRSANPDQPNIYKADGAIWLIRSPGWSFLSQSPGSIDLDVDKERIAVSVGNSALRTCILVLNEGKGRRDPRIFLGATMGGLAIHRVSLCAVYHRQTTTHIARYDERKTLGWNEKCDVHPS